MMKLQGLYLSVNCFQIYVMNGIAQGELMTHRVSGYYTSSQSSVNDTDIGMYCSKLRVSAPVTVDFDKC